VADLLLAALVAEPGDGDAAAAAAHVAPLVRAFAMGSTPPPPPSSWVAALPSTPSPASLAERCCTPKGLPA
jgi:hypothetical protein